MEHWRELFSNLLNRLSTVDPAALGFIPQMAIMDGLDLPPLWTRSKKWWSRPALTKIWNSCLPAENFKAGGLETLITLHKTLTSIWEKEIMPNDFCDAIIIPLFKNKENKADCGNYHGISSLSIVEKILVWVILNDLISSVSEKLLPKCQCGFRPGCSTVALVFSLWQVQEKCIKQQMDIYAVLIDPTKAFDAINKEALWVILTKLGCPHKFIQIFWLFQDSMTDIILSNGDTSTPFSIINGKKQGCVHAPVLFKFFSTCIWNHALPDSTYGVYQRYRLDGSLFNLRRLNTRVRTLERIIMEALSTDDCTFIARLEHELQTSIRKCMKASQLFGLTISLSKTEVMHQPAPGSTATAPN